MANVQQNYIPGEAFNTYFLSDLTAQNAADWTWTGRTLSCYKSELCGYIDLGQEVQFDFQNEQISGVWILNKNIPIILCCLGQTGEISVKIIENNTQYPLADTQHLYKSTTYLTSTTEHNVYYGTYVSANIIPNEGTIIKQIKYAYPIDGGMRIVSSDPNKQIITNNLTRYMRISVDYAEGGYLEYFSNKNTRNPDA